VRIIIDQSGRVSASATIDLPLPASTVWGQMRDFRRFITVDPLHRAVRTRTNGPGGPSPVGTTLVIPHRVLGLGPDRVGRILRWTEGSGFVFSDLSRRGANRGFPHVCAYEVAAAAPGCSRLTVWARGRWTAALIPRWAARLWIAWVMRATEARLVAEFTALARWQRRVSSAPCRTTRSAR
jgi:hypothetical protein